jgi:hypothetical protein
VELRGGSHLRHAQQSAPPATSPRVIYSRISHRGRVSPSNLVSDQRRIVASFEDEYGTWKVATEALPMNYVERVHGKLVFSRSDEQTHI